LRPAAGLSQAPASAKTAPGGSGKWWQEQAQNTIKGTISLPAIWGMHWDSWLHTN
jgi:hypothetical protein